MNWLKFFVFLIGFAGSALGRNLRHAPHDPRIVNGTDAELGQFPFVVTVHHDGYQTCGGSILNEWWILTAAHCVDGYGSNGFSIVAGTNDYEIGGVHVDVKSVIMHEKFDNQKSINDLALLQSSGPRTSHIRYVMVQTISDEECLRLLGFRFVPNPRNICAGIPGGGQGECTGDSGGPLIIGEDGYQVGVVSWSVKPCASPDHPGVYTEVSYYIDWLKEKTGM